MPACQPCTFHGLPALRLRADDGAQAIISLFGGQVLSWTCSAGVEQLYLSPATTLDGSTAIRGGVPLVFPQFNTRGPLPRHGFARTAAWRVLHDGVATGECSVTLTLPPSAHLQALWPHDFACSYTVALHADRLQLTLTVRNQGLAELAFQAALHSYLAVGDVAGFALEGPQACQFEDCLAGAEAGLQRHVPWQPPQAVDRIYHQAPAQLRLHAALGRRLVQQSGFADTVLWNPGADAAGRPADLPADGYRHFVCVEAAQIVQPVRLASGQTWSGSQTIGRLH